MVDLRDVRGSSLWQVSELSPRCFSTMRSVPAPSIEVVDKAKEAGGIGVEADLDHP